MKDDAWGTMFVGNLKMFQTAGFDLVEQPRQPGRSAATYLALQAGSIGRKW